MKTDVLTGLRFWAAAIVVVFHFGRDIELVKTAARGFLTAGPQMVGFFFVLSGFIMGYVYLARKDFNFGEYLVARFARIVPVYMLALFFLISLRPMSAAQFVYDFTMLKAWFPPYAAWGNYPGWSISVEVFFYAIFPFLIFLIKGLRFSVAGFLATSLLFWLFTQFVLTNIYFSDFYKAGGKVAHGLIFYFPISHVSSFLIGISTSYVLRHFECELRGSRFSILFCVVTVFSAGVIYFVLNNRISDFMGFKFLSAAGGLAPFFAIFIFSVVVSSRYFEWLLANRFSVLLGESSYALYILQLPVYVAFDSFVVKKYLVAGDSAFWLYFVSLLLISIFTFLYLERPVRDLINRKYRKFTLDRKKSYAF